MRRPADVISEISAGDRICVTAAGRNPESYKVERETGHASRLLHLAGKRGAERRMFLEAASSQVWITQNSQGGRMARRVVALEILAKASGLSETGLFDSITGEREDGPVCEPAEKSRDVLREPICMPGSDPSDADVAAAAMSKLFGLTTTSPEAPCPCPSCRRPMATATILGWPRQVCLQCGLTWGRIADLDKGLAYDALADLAAAVANAEREVLRATEARDRALADLIAEVARRGGR